MFGKVIGILGGMGPVASADSYVTLTKTCQQKYNAVQDSDFPTVILYSLPLKNFDNIGFGEDLEQRAFIVDQLLKALHILEKAGAELIVIDCNTVHYFFEELQNKIKVPIINLIQLTIEYIVEVKYKKVAVLSSQTSRDLQLYTKPLERLGVEVLNTSESEQETVNEAILAVMSGLVTPIHIVKLNKIINEFNAKGAECILMGCTEISNIAGQFSHNAVLVDSEALAIEKALELAK